MILFGAQQDLAEAELPLPIFQQELQLLLWQHPLHQNGRSGVGSKAVESIYKRRCPFGWFLGKNVSVFLVVSGGAYASDLKDCD